MTGQQPFVDFRTEPAAYRHWRLAVDGRVATLTMDVDEAGGLAPGYELKLNSYDLGVDIELYDAVQRLRFEHPEVSVVVLTSARSRATVLPILVKLPPMYASAQLLPWKAIVFTGPLTAGAHGVIL